MHSRVHETRDVIWLKRMYYPKPAIVQDVAIHIPTPDEETPIGDGESKSSSSGESVKDGDDDDDDNAADQEPEEPEDKDDDDSDDESLKPVQGTTTRSRRIVSQPARFIDELGASAIH